MPTPHSPTPHDDPARPSAGIAGRDEAPPLLPTDPDGGDRLAVAGRLYAPHASAHRPARLLLDAGRDGAGAVLRLDGGGEQEALAPSALRWPARLDTPVQRIELADGRVFETHDHAGADALRTRLKGGRGARLHGLERLRPRLLAIAVLLLAVCAAAVRWGLPYAADRAAMLAPYGVEAAIGQGVLDALDRTVLDPSQAAPARRQALQDTLDGLLHARAAREAAQGRQATPVRLELRRAGRLGANALALPGGAIVVTDSLLDLAGDPRELAGVLAHEIGHIDARHGLRRLARAVGLSAAVMLVSGDAGSFLNDAVVAGTGLLDAAYSRDFEREADARAAALLAAAGADPDSLARMLERLEAKAGGGALPGWLSTHPPTAERIETLRGATQR